MAIIYIYTYVLVWYHVFIKQNVVLYFKQIKNVLLLNQNWVDIYFLNKKAHKWSPYHKQNTWEFSRNLMMTLIYIAIYHGSIITKSANDIQNKVFFWTNDIENQEFAQKIRGSRKMRGKKSFFWKTDTKISRSFTVKYMIEIYPENLAT